MKITELVNNSDLIKDDHVKVYKYKEEYIIKKVPHSVEGEKYVESEKKLLEKINNAGISINVLEEYEISDGHIFSKYGFVKSVGEIDFIKVGANISKLHGMKEDFYSIDSFELATSNLSESKKILKEILGLHYVEILSNISDETVKNFKNAMEGRVCDTLIHGDINIGNIIAPDVLIDTESFTLGVKEMDLARFYRMGHRFGDFDAMNQLLEGYGFTGDLSEIEPFLFFIDYRSLMWTIINNQGSEARIEEVKKRLDNWSNFSVLHTLY